jgi:hypothetical protein
MEKHHLMLSIDIVHYMVYSYYLETALPVCTVRPAMRLDTSPKRLLAVQQKMDKNSASALATQANETVGCIRRRTFMAQTL